MKAGGTSAPEDARYLTVRQVKQLEEQRDAHVRHSELLLKDKYILLDQLNQRAMTDSPGSPRSPGGARRPLAAKNGPSRSPRMPVSPKEAVAMAQRLREARRAS